MEKNFFYHFLSFMLVTKYRDVCVYHSEMDDTMQTDVIDITRRGFEL